jgi:hypothetical protein
VFCLGFLRFLSPFRPQFRLPETNIWLLFFDDVAPHTLRRLAEEAGVCAHRYRRRSVSKMNVV